MLGVSRGRSLGVGGRGTWVVIALGEERSFEGRLDQSTGVECWVSHRRAREGQCFVIVRRWRWRARIGRAGGGGRRSWAPRCLFVGLRAEKKTSCRLLN